VIDSSDCVCTVVVQRVSDSDVVLQAKVLPRRRAQGDIATVSHGVAADILHLSRWQLPTVGRKS